MTYFINLYNFHAILSNWRSLKLVNCMKNSNSMQYFCIVLFSKFISELFFNSLFFVFLCHFSLAISECVSMYCIRTLACFIYFDRNKNRICRIRRRKLAKKSAKKMNEQNKCVNKNSGLILKYSEHISFCSCYLHCCSNTKNTHTHIHSHIVISLKSSFSFCSMIPV